MRIIPTQPLVGRLPNGQKQFKRGLVMVVEAVGQECVDRQVSVDETDREAGFSFRHFVGRDFRHLN